MLFARASLTHLKNVPESVQQFTSLPPSGYTQLIINANSLPSGTMLDTDVCIIGAGPAGISLAQAFDGKPFRVILLEGGQLFRVTVGVHQDLINEVIEVAGHQERKLAP